MAQQTVIVLDEGQDKMFADPDFVDKLRAAIDETVRTHQPARIGTDYGMVMPYHHRYDPTLYLSYGGILKALGQTTVTKLPKDIDESVELAREILSRHVGP